MSLKKKMNVLVACATLFLTACGTGVTQKTIEINDNAYLLGVGDQLEITVYNQQKMSGEFIIEGDGKIAFPLLESVKAEGTTINELRENIKNALHPKYLKNPKVSIQFVKRRDIFILGEVESPGKYEYIPNMTFLEAVATAEGFTPRAAQSYAEIRRRHEQEIEVFKGTEDEFLQPGDVIVVKRRLF